MSDSDRPAVTPIKKSDTPSPTDAAPPEAAEAKPQSADDGTDRLILLRHDQMPSGGIVAARIGTIGVHIQYEVEFNSSLAAKSLDPWGPHIQIDLDAPSMIFDVTGGSIPNITPAGDSVSRRLENAGKAANRVAYALTSDLLTQLRANRAVNS
jgi:hypothetical protein